MWLPACAMIVAMSDYRFRPISTWPGVLLKPHDRRKSPFRADHPTTMRELAHELKHLEARDVVVEIALREADLRIDGMPRATAKPPEHPGIVLSFDSQFGPLRYACDSFTEWPQNLRAIARSLEALRQVDRYGVVKRGEQYTGFRQIEATSSSKDDVRAELWKIIMRHGSEAQRTRDDDLDDIRLVRRARRITHPDVALTEDAKKLWPAVEHAAATLGV